MKRFLVVFVAIILIVACMAFSVSAALVQPLNFKDSVIGTNLSDNDAVLSIRTDPRFFYTTILYANNGQTEVISGGFNNVVKDSVVATSTSELNSSISLYYANVQADGEDFPVYFPAVGLQNGNILEVDISVGAEAPVNPNYSEFRVIYLKSDGTQIMNRGTYNRYRDESDIYHYTGSFTFSGLTDEITNYYIEFYYHRSGTGIQTEFDMNLSVDYFRVTMPYSQWTSLGSDTGEQLDDMMNRPVTPDPPAGSGSVDDYHDIESGLLEDTEAGRNEALSALGSIGVIYGFMTSFTYLVGICELFFGLPLITELLTVSLALSVFILLFNLFTDIDRRVRSGKKESAKGKYAKKAHKGGHK